MKKSLVLLLVILTAFTVFAYDRTYQDIGENIVAKVNGEIIELNLLNARSNSVQLFSQIREINQDFFNLLIYSDEGNKLLDLYSKDVLERIINQILFIQFVESKEIEMSREYLKEMIYDNVENLFSDPSYTKDELEYFLLSQGYEDKESLKVDTYYKYLYDNSIQMLYEVIASEYQISDEEIKKEYDTNKNLYVSKPNAEIKMIRFSSIDEASRTYKRILDGYYSFEEVYAEIEKTGDANNLPVEITDEESEIMQIIKNNPVGFVSKPMEAVKAGESFFFKIDKKNPSRQLSFEDVKMTITYKLQDEKAKIYFENDLDKDFKEFKNNSNVIINTKHFME